MGNPVALPNLKMLRLGFVLAASFLTTVTTSDVEEVLRNAAMENEQLFEGDILSLTKNAMTANWK